MSNCEEKSGEKSNLWMSRIISSSAVRTSSPSLLRTDINRILHPRFCLEFIHVAVRVSFEPQIEFVIAADDNNDECVDAGADDAGTLNNTKSSNDSGLSLVMRISGVSCKSSLFCAHSSLRFATIRNSAEQKPQQGPICVLWSFYSF